MTPPDRASAWADLVRVVEDLHATDKGSTKSKMLEAALSAAAKQWGLANGQREPAPPRAEGESEVLVPFGWDKGKPLSAVADLTWLRRAVESSVNDPEKERWRSQNQALLDAIQAEEARR